MWWGGRGRGRGFGIGMGFGPNPYWSCRWFPWLPRGWLRFSSVYGYGTPYGYGAPYPMITGAPFFPQFPPMWPYGVRSIVQPGTMPPTQEREMLEQYLKFFEDQLSEIRKRLSELEPQT